MTFNREIRELVPGPGHFEELLRGCAAVQRGHGGVLKKWSPEFGGIFHTCSRIIQSRKNGIFDRFDFEKANALLRFAQVGPVC